MNTPLRDVFESGPFQPTEGSSLMETGSITATRGYRSDERDDLGRVQVSGFPHITVELWSPDDVKRYRDWVNDGLDAAAKAAFGDVSDV